MSSITTPTPAKAKPSHPVLRYLLCVVLGMLLASSVIYFSVIRESNRTIASGRETITELTSANAKLRSDLESANAVTSGLTEQLADRQRIINSINKSVSQLGNGLTDGIATLDQVIESIQSIIGILQHG